MFSGVGMLVCLGRRAVAPCMCENLGVSRYAKYGMLTFALPTAARVDLARTRPTMMFASLAPRLLCASAALRGAPLRGAPLWTAGRARPLCSMQLPPHLEDMREELASGEAQLFDVREPNEAEAGMLRDAELVPLSYLQQGGDPMQRVGPAPVDPAKVTYVHCAAGIRVHYAAPILEKMGFERVVPLQEGFATLCGMGFEQK
jgi:rhodanese-related sulfurtransferase